MLVLTANSNPGTATWSNATALGGGIVYAQTSSALAVVTGAIGSGITYRVPVSSGAVLSIPAGLLQSGDRVLVRLLIKYAVVTTVPTVPVFQVFHYFGTNGVTGGVSIFPASGVQPASQEQGFCDTEITITTAGASGLASSLAFADVNFTGAPSLSPGGASGVPFDSTVSPFYIQPALAFDPLGTAPAAGDEVSFLYSQVTVIRPGTP